MRFQLRYLLILGFFLIGSIGAVPAVAQMLPLGQSSGTPGPFGSDVRVEGLYETAPVRIDGAPIFRIANLMTQPPSGLPVGVRAQFIDAAIAQVLALREDGRGTIYDPKTLTVSMKRDGSEAYLVVADAHHDTPIPILTVTTADGQYNRLPVATLGESWRRLLQSALIAGLDKRQPAEVKRNYNLLLRVGGAIVALTLIGLAAMIALRRVARAQHDRLSERKEVMTRDQKHGAAPADGGDADRRRRFLAQALRAAAPEAQLQQTQAAIGMIGWLLVLVWAAAITWGLFLFPQTMPYGRLLVRTGVQIAFIWIVAALANRAIDMVITRFAQAYGRGGLTSEERARHLLRAPTISRAFGSFKSFIVLFIASLATLGALNIPVASVVTIGGVAALAFSFAAQNLVRDFLNGLLVLIEDQYVVGDYVMIGDYNGIVENLTLRVVQIRDARGNLITIPHSAAVQVVNASRDWSRIDYRVAIDPNCDPLRATEILRGTLDSLKADPEYAPMILEPVEWIGVELLSKNAIVVRASIRTAPLRQFELRRVINEQVHRALAEAEIPLGLDPVAPPSPAAFASPDPA